MKFTKPVVMTNGNELRVIYPSGKVCYYKFEESEQKEHTIIVTMPKDLKLNGYYKIDYEVLA